MPAAKWARMSRAVFQDRLSVGVYLEATSGVRLRVGIPQFIANDDHWTLGFT
jgi:hypothetical protein